MKVSKLIGMAAVAGLAIAPAALAQTTQTGKPAAAAARVDDGALKSRIEARLKSSATLEDSDIEVDVDNGVVTLTGTVHSQAQSLRARNLAKIAGVSNVENKLTVDSKTARTMDRAGDKTERAADKVADKADRAGDRIAEKSRSAADKTEGALHRSSDKAEKAATSGKDDEIDVDAKITDAWITTKVKAGFLNEDALKGSDINVDTANHVVTLKGTVASAAGRARAIQLAKQTRGVTRVVDRLAIAPAK